MSTSLRLQDEDDGLVVELTDEDREAFRRAMKPKVAAFQSSRQVMNSIRAIVFDEAEADEEGRKVFVGRSRNEGFKYADNTVVTARYPNFLFFLVMFLFESFQKFANTYFLIVVIFQAIPLISITDG